MLIIIIRYHGLKTNRVSLCLSSRRLLAKDLYVQNSIEINVNEIDNFKEDTRAKNVFFNTCG